jgi:flagellar hook-associated protein 3 FlgL
MRISTFQITSSGVREMLLRQSELQQTQLQLATQKRVINPSDDPVAATSINLLRTEIAQFEQFNKNNDAAKSSLELEETIMSSSTNILFRVEELMVSLGNGTYSEPQFDAIKVELEERLGELMGLANTQNANGDYLFSGSKVDSKPYVVDNLGNVSYKGDQDQRLLRVSSGVVVPISDSGFDIFSNVRDGNGSFSTNAAIGNAGSGIISNGSYTAPPNFLAEPYSVDFGLNGLGELEYTATGLTSASVVAGPTLYQDGDDINFNGIQLSISGTPQAGDSFGVSPSTKQDIFTSIQNVVNAIDAFVDSPSGRAQFRTSIASEQITIDNGAINIDVIRAKIGSRLNALESEESSNLSILVTSRAALSDLEDLDIVEASTRFSQQLVVLEAAQASFVRVQDLNLFNFIR